MDTLEQRRDAHFAWQRFWVERSGSINLSDGGFLIDPTTMLSGTGQDGARQLADLQGFGALALLGEPGIGKSTTLRSEADRLAESAPADTVAIYADLRAYSSDALLYKHVFESRQFVEWSSGDKRLILHLDSLDEALLRIETIANLLSEELRRHPIERLAVRIACRTAVWPAATLERALVKIWGEKSVGVFELAPLRRRDVAAAAEAVGIDADRFFRELYAANAVPFAIKPLTLNLLLSLFIKEGRLPHSVSELYSRGCLLLCEEQNSSRRDTRRLGTCTPAQRLRIAGRIAAITMFSNRYAIWTGPEGEGIPAEDVALSAIAGEREDMEPQAFVITEPAVRETLDTGLFTSRGGGRMGWAHQGYAEFLAAQYLCARKVKPANVLKLLLHPSGGAVPQLAVVTAWAASADADVRRALMHADPMLLIQGDLTGWQAEDLAQLTDALMAALADNRVHDFTWGISNYYGRLRHPKLAEQLRPYLLDSSTNVIVRRTAILIAERCGLKELQPELLQLALDKSADVYLRGRAIDALSSCGDETVPAKLLPFARDEMGPDPNDEMKGYALQQLWPAHLSAEGVFALIRNPNAGYIGSYVLFLTRTLPQSLSERDLPVALAWAAGFAKASGHGGDFHRRSLADSILVRAWRHIDNPEVAGPLLDYVFERLRPGQKLFGGTGRRETEGFYAELDADPGKRRVFILAAAGRHLARFDAYHLTTAGLLRPSDLGWLLTHCPGGTASDGLLNSDSLCEMVAVIANFDDQAAFESLYAAAEKWPALWSKFRGVFEGIPLASADAQQLRQTQEMMERLKERKPEPVSPPPAQRIAEQLDRFEKGDPAAWWRLNLELTITPTSQVYGDDLEFSIADQPGWRASDESTRARIVDAAKKYLALAESAAPKWMGTSNPYRSDLAAFRALILLRQFDEAAYRALPREVWAKWADTIVAIPKATGRDKSAFQDVIVFDAINAAPREFVAAVREWLKRDRERTRKDAAKGAGQPKAASFFELRELREYLQNDDLKSGLFAELQDTSNTGGEFETLLDVLLGAGYRPAFDFAVSQLSTPVGKYPLEAAVSLATHSAAQGWSAIWRRVVADEDFCERFFLEMAAHYRFETGFLADLTEDQIAEIYVHLDLVFPRKEDPRHESGEAHWVGPRESLANLRDGIPQEIASRGTDAAISALRWMIGKLPEQKFLLIKLLEAQRLMRMKTWTPVSTQGLLRLLASRERVLVQSADDLCDLLVELLRRYERELHGEQNPIRALWDRQGIGATFQPVEEDALSDSVRLFLKRELAENGVVANREVEVARKPGAPIGRRTDIRIDAVRRSARGEAYDVLTAVVETKGCWNKELFGALTAQLYGDYMLTLRAPVGIFLVGWFDKPKWDTRDARRRQTPDLAISEVQGRLDTEASAVPQGYLVRAVVVDCHAP